MEKSDAGDHGLLGELIARAMLDNLNRFIVPNVAGPARLVPLAALMDGDFSLPALRQAAQRRSGAALRPCRVQAASGAAPAGRLRRPNAASTGAARSRSDSGGSRPQPILRAQSRGT